MHCKMKSEAFLLMKNNLIDKNSKLIRKEVKKYIAIKYLLNVFFKSEKSFYVNMKGRKFVMNKLKKQLVKIGVTGCTLLSTIAGVGAASVSITQNIKNNQQWGTLPSATKSSSSSYGTIRLNSLQTTDSVTFYLVSSQGTGSALTYNQSLVGQTLNIYYNGTAYQGDTVYARFRNHNWSFNTGYMTGTMDYK